ncbi:class I SAM-dependent methyltransferase [Thermoleophilum album]|jgi:SAM-dependent methyltransferase|uniref:class I SAM-dependent methyltransferase n=1 Tax=Thermoleophilum album TaxID=29539 RepID=UPI00237D0478|nr:class I SAM-dependent methyltransferase [Thermoleophilum album]WDT94402.1 class I SAM-dependent methyltransferase [Thermoleophilum album]
MPAEDIRRPELAAARLDSGSFRDPESRVFYADGEVLRALSAEGLADFEALAQSALFARAQAEGRIVRTERVDDWRALDLPLVKEPAAVLRHERVPFVSYPYEWPFSMLKDAALLQLDLLRDALAEALVLKDASPYNVQFVGARATFVDVGSFERLRPGETWTAYRQFCMLFLYPLLLQALRGVDYQPLLRGQIDGIDPFAMRALLPLRDRLRRGVFTHVTLHARLQQRYADRAGEIRSSLSRQLADPALQRRLLDANVRKMRKLVERLRWQPASGVWVSYGERNTYSDEDTRLKEQFVEEAAAGARRRLVWDLGCNNGRYARIAARHADYVVAVDADQGPVELLYRDLREEGNDRILPLVMNLADPSPGLGWRGAERRPLWERGRPDLVLALALIHHIAISANVPVREFLDWLHSLGSELVIEFPTRDDPMVQKLLAGKRAGLHPDYERERFERELRELFEIRKSVELPSGTRILYHAYPRGSGAGSAAAASGTRAGG